MCMNEFVKRLYDFMGIYRFFWSQNSHFRYLPIYYRYFFSRNLSTSAPSPQSLFFGGNRYFSIFPLIDISSVFSSRRRLKTDFSAIYQSTKMIFCSLIITEV